MANPEHLKILRAGVTAWNRWREEANAAETDLSQADLSGADLCGADLRGADLSRANLEGANLEGANLSRANLNAANLRLAKLSGASFWNTQLTTVDLSETIGLDNVDHHGPSSLGFDTFIMSKGDIPQGFLRGAGVHDILLNYAAALARAPFEFCYCFISYSVRDGEFAQRLHAHLQRKGIRCWFEPENLKSREKVRVRIDESIRGSEKLLLVLSENSVHSDWVQQEVEAACEKERREKRPVLFPIQIDLALREVKAGWAADLRRNRHLVDFRGWLDGEAYDKAFKQLVRGLKSNPYGPD